MVFTYGKKSTLFPQSYTFVQFKNLFPADGKKKLTEWHTAVLEFTMNLILVRY